jgi:hypothetical protein
MDAGEQEYGDSKHLTHQKKRKQKNIEQHFFLIQE